MGVCFMNDAVTVRAEVDHVMLWVDTHGIKLHPDVARSVAAGLCVAAERVDDCDTERGLDAA